MTSLREEIEQVAERFGVATAQVWRDHLHEGYPRWPTEVADIQQRYSDAPPAHLRVLTAPAFGAAKLSAWLDRRSSRDLYDLYAMAARGPITPESNDLFSRLGSFTRIPAWTWSGIPDPAQWRVELGHQLRLAIEPEEAANVAQQAWTQATH